MLLSSFYDLPVSYSHFSLLYNVQFSRVKTAQPCCFSLPFSFLPGSHLRRRADPEQAWPSPSQQPCTKGQCSRSEVQGQKSFGLLTPSSCALVSSFLVFTELGNNYGLQSLNSVTVVTIKNYTLCGSRRTHLDPAAALALYLKPKSLETLGREKPSSCIFTSVLASSLVFLSPPPLLTPPPVTHFGCSYDCASPLGVGWWWQSCLQLKSLLIKIATFLKSHRRYHITVSTKLFTWHSG